MNTKLRSLSIKQVLGVVALSLLPLSTGVLAESVAVPITQQAQDMQSIDRPMRGETQDSVQQRFGQPNQAGMPIGNPPITKWQYNNFTVYFEYDRVIHTVLNPHK